MKQSETPQPMDHIVAIDGPAASGKSTVAEQLAAQLGYLYFDTGVMYRAITYCAMDRLGSVADEAAVIRLAETVTIDVKAPSLPDGRACDVSIDGQDVTWEIRSREVESQVSQVSAYPGVRAALTLQQRRIGLGGEVVMVGRDIGTVVLPEARYKFYLDASVEVRAKRRYDEIIQRGGSADYDEICAAMKRRDQIDSTRAVAPLKPATDAVIIHTDNLSAAEVVDQIRGYIGLVSRV